MSTLTKACIVVFGFAGLAMLLHPFGPFGGFWPPSAICPVPSEAQFPLFATVAIVEAAAFGVGIAFLVWGYRFVRYVFDIPWQAVAVYLSIAWWLINWYPHDALHMNAGIDLQQMLYIEFGFHLTLIAATCLVAYIFLLAEAKRNASFVRGLVGSRGVSDVRRKSPDC